MHSLCVWALGLTVKPMVRFTILARKSSAHFVLTSTEWSAFYFSHAILLTEFVWDLYVFAVCSGRIVTNLLQIESV